MACPSLLGQAYALYGMGVAQLIAKLGGRVVFSGPITDVLLGAVDPRWDAVAVVEYPRCPGVHGASMPVRRPRILAHSRALCVERRRTPAFAARGHSADGPEPARSRHADPTARGLAHVQCCV